MTDDSGPPRFLPGATARCLASSDTVAPAQALSGCGCGGASSGACTCSNAATARSGFVYVLGTVDCKFPDQCVSHEFQWAAETMGIEQGNDPLRTWIYRVLTAEPTEPNPEEPEPRKRGAKKPEARNPEPKKSRPRYIARQLCWELTVEAQLAYHLALDDWQDLDDLIECLRELPDVDLVQIAGSSSMIPVEACQGEVAPVLKVAQISAYDPKEFVEWVGNALQTPGGAPPAARNAADLVLSLLSRLVQAADNFGDEDQWRALNFLAVRYEPLYELYAEKVGRDDYILDSIRVLPSRMSRQRPLDRQIVDVVFSYVNTKGACAVEKYFTRVDVTCMFPFIITTLQRKGKRGAFVPNYFDR